MRFWILAVPLLVAGCLSDYKYVNETIDVSSNLTLDSDVVKTKYTFSTPGVVLDGNGHMINGDCNTSCIGLVISADNVVIRNVTITGFDGGVMINNAASGVRFENVTVRNNVKHGMFVNVGANNFTCRNCTVSDNGTMGIYLEYNTSGAIIEDSEISFNGYRDKDTGDWFETQKNKRKDKREGIAIDSSQGNTIRNTDFFGNALAGVTLYRNCGERGIRREWGANYNVISGGNFSDNILIASRQDKDLSDWDCVEPYVLGSKYVMDEAEHNTVENVILEGNAAIVIRDDNNTVRNVSGGRLIAHSAVRNLLLQPLMGLGLNFSGSSYQGDPAFVVP